MAADNQCSTWWGWVRRWMYTYPVDGSTSGGRRHILAPRPAGSAEEINYELNEELLECMELDRSD